MTDKKLDPADLAAITGRTLNYYDRFAESFWEGTRDHDVSQNIDALLQHIGADPPFTLLDFGCGPGRDLKVFIERGHMAIGLEGYSFRTAIHESRELKGKLSWWQFIRQSTTPELPVVLLEDFGALIGLALALLGVGLTLLTGEAVFDALGTIGIGLLLGVIAAYPFPSCRQDAYGSPFLPQ